MEGPLAVERHRQRGQREVFDPGVVEPLEDPQGLGLRRLRHVAHVRHRRGRDARGGEALAPGLGVFRSQPRVEQRDELVAIANAVRVRPEA